MQWFVGRKEELDRLRALVDREALVTITGLPGIGKSCTAKRLLLGDPELAQVTLLDDADSDLEEARRRVATAPPGSRFLVTSADPLGLPRETIFRLEPMAPDDALELLRVHLNRAGYTGAVDESAVDALLRIPLLLEMAAHLTHTLPLSRIIERRWEPSFLHGPNDGRHHSYSDAVRAALTNKTELATVVLSLLSAAQVQIDVEAIEQTFPDNVLQAVSELASGGWVRREGTTLEATPIVALVPPPEPAVLQDVETRLGELLAPLLDPVWRGDVEAIAKFDLFVPFLATPNIEYQSEVVNAARAIATTFVPHPDLQMLNRLAENAPSTLTAKWLARAYDDVEAYPEAHVMYEAAKDDPETEVDLFHLRFKTNDPRVRPTVDDPRLETRIAASEICKSLLKAEPPSHDIDTIVFRLRSDNDLRWLVRLLTSLGIHHSRQRNYLSAEKNYDAVLEICRRCKMAHHEHTVRVNLGAIYIRQCQYVKARKIYSELPTATGNLHTLGVREFNLGMAALCDGPSIESELHFDRTLVHFHAEGERPAHRDITKYLRNIVRFCRDINWSPIEFEDGRIRQFAQVVSGFIGDRVEIEDPELWAFADIFQSDDDAFGKINQVRHVMTPDTQSLAIAAISRMGELAWRMAWAEIICQQNNIQSDFVAVLDSHLAYKAPSGDWTPIGDDSTSKLLLAWVRHPEGLSDDVLVETLWPDDRSKKSSLTNRIKVTISNLRKAGFVVERRDGSYLLETPILNVGVGEWSWLKASQSQ